MDLSLRSIKPMTDQRITLKKHVISMSCTLESATQSCDTGQRISFFDSCQLTITWMSMRMSIIYNAKNTDCICLRHLHP